MPDQQQVGDAGKNIQCEKHSYGGAERIDDAGNLQRLDYRKQKRGKQEPSRLTEKRPRSSQDRRKMADAVANEIDAKGGNTANQRGPCRYHQKIRRVG